MNDFDDIFKSSYDSQQEPLPPHIWNRIEEELHNGDEMKAGKKYLAFMRIAACFIIFISGFVLYAAFMHFNHKELTAEKNIHSSERSDHKSNIHLLNKGNIQETANSQHASVKLKKDVRQSNSGNIISPENSNKGNIPSTANPQDKSKKDVSQSNLGNIISPENSNKENIPSTANPQVKSKKDVGQVTRGNIISPENSNNGNIPSTDNPQVKSKKGVGQLNPGSIISPENSNNGNILSTANPQVKSKKDAGQSNPNLTNSRNPADTLSILQLNNSATRSADINRTNFNTEPAEIASIKLSQGLHQTQLIHEEKITEKSVNIASPSTSPNGKSKTDKNANRSGSFYLTAFFSPDIAGRNLQQEYDFNNEDKSQICKGEKNAFSYTTGVLVQYQLSKIWALQSGLSFSTFSTSVSPKVISASENVNGEIQFQLPTSFGVVNIKNPHIPNPVIGDTLKLAKNSCLHLNYFTIPFLFKYTLINRGSFNLNASFGSGINIVSDADMKVILPLNGGEDTKYVKDIKGLRKSNFSAIFGMEALYHCSRTISVSLQPVLDYSINSINHNTPVKTTPYTIGFMAGINIPL